MVPTCLRPDFLLRCLHALVQQDLPKEQYEIIVVDACASQETRRIVMAVARRCNGTPAVQYLIADDASGLAAARNRGWMYARGAVIAFTDDDAVPDSDWLRQGMAALTPNIAAVSGDVVAPLPVAAGHHERQVAAQREGEFVSANCFVHQRALSTVGGFDERFSEGWRDDADLHFSLMERFGGQLRIRHEPRARVVHAVAPAAWGASLSQQRQLQFDALLYRKHPGLYRSRIQQLPRWDYYAIVIAAALALAAAPFSGLYTAVMAASVWSVLTVRCCIERLTGSPLTVRHTVQAIGAAVAVPPLAVFWRVVGALRYRKLLA